MPLALRLARLAGALPAESAPRRPIVDGRGLTPESTIQSQPALDAATRSIVSTGIGIVAARRVGVEAVERAVSESIAGFRTPEGRYL